MTPQRRRSDDMDPSEPPASPPAKRVGMPTPVVTPDGPDMDHGQLSKAIYVLNRQFASMEQWALVVNDAIGDHAQRIDHNGDRARNQGKLGAELNLKMSKLEGKVPQIESDLREAARQTVENDAGLKSIVAQMAEDMKKLKELEEQARSSTAGELGRKINDLDNAFSAMKAAVASGGGSTPEGYAVRLTGVESNLGAVDKKIEEVKQQMAATGAEVGRIAAETSRLAQVEPMLVELTAAFSRLENATATSAAGQATHGYQSGDPMANGNDAWSRARAGDMGGIGGMGNMGGQGGRNDNGGGGQGATGGGGQGATYHDMNANTYGATTTNTSKHINMEFKVALMDKHQYNDSHPEQWHKAIRTYMIGRHVDVKPFLDWIEARGSRKIQQEDLDPRAMGIMVDFDTLQCSREMWNFLNLCLGKSSHAQRTFNNVEELNGAEVYRRLVVPLSTTSIIRRNALRDKVQNPKRAKSMLTVMEAVDEWEFDNIAFRKAGGKEMDSEERLAQLMKLLPTGLSFEMLSKADDFQDPEELIEWLRNKSRFVAEHGSKGEQLHRVEGQAPPLMTEEGEDEYEGPYFDEDDDDERPDFNKMNDEEILAFVKNGGSFMGGPNRRPFKRQVGPRQRGNVPPRARPTGQQAGSRAAGPAGVPPRNRADIRYKLRGERS